MDKRSSGSGLDDCFRNLSISIPIVIPVSEPETNTNNTAIVALDFDLNKTPPSSPDTPPAAVPTNVAVPPADQRCNSCALTDIPTVLCPECSNSVHVDCLKPTENTPELMCAKCSMECHRRKKIRRTVSDDDFDMNVSPTCDSDGGDVARDSKIQDACGNPFIGYTVNSSNTQANLQIDRVNLDIATQNANSVYLQALKDYISEKRGVLGNGWCVTLEYSESIGKNSPIYCAPNGSRFNSMQKVAHHLGLLSGCDSCEPNENGSVVGLLQNGSLRMVSNGGNALKVDPMENCNRLSELFLQDSFPVQFEDFCIMSIGKIDPRLPFHNTSQIWPIGYKSIWHDKITGSIFVCNVIRNGDCGPLFRVNRYPCTKQFIPNASRVIFKSKGGSSNEISSCLTHKNEDMTLNNFVNGDVIGEFSVEGRSPSSAWKIMLETLLFACHQTFQDLKVLNFCCNHSLENSPHFCGSYGVDSLDKFRCLDSQVNSIPRSILTVDQLEDSCNVLRRWLQLDRFGLDVEFVQELIEQLPEADACSEYKYLNARYQNMIAHTIGSGFFSILRKQPMVSNTLTENRERPGPPGNAITSKLPHGLIGNVLQAYEFCLRFHNVLGQEASLSRQNLEYELLNPYSGSIKSIEGDKVENFTSCSTIVPDTPNDFKRDFSPSLLSNFHMSMLKVLVEDMLSKVVISDPCGSLESKSRKWRKKNMENNGYCKKSMFGIFPVNEITWPELVRRYIMVLLSMDDNFDDLDITSRKFDEMFRCLNGDGGPLCSYLTGMAAIEADAMVLAEASKNVFSSLKTKIVDFIIDKKDLNINNSAIETKGADTKCPEWIKLLEPIRKQPTNVGAKIRNRVLRSLDIKPPLWATEMLLKSISKEVYKGNAAGPTKKIVVEVLEKVRNENPLTKKKSKESRIVKTVSDVIIKRCRMVLRFVAGQDENKTCNGFMAESLLKANVSYDVGNPATVSRPLDFRTIDLRLDAGFYGDSHESFIEDVREVLQNLHMTYGKLPKYLDLIEKISKRIEELYEQEVLTLVNKVDNYWNGSTSSSEETKNELNAMFAETISSSLFVAPWEVGICKVCAKDENDHILLLCDRCDSEYHTYCLNPPLERIPKASWYCPPCISFITSQTLAQEETGVLSQSQPPEKKRIQREFTRNGLEELAELADTMELVDYWNLGVKERVFLLQFLCDETLCSAVIRNHVNADGSDSRRNFLGQDSARRLYWVLGRPERLFVSGPHSEDEGCETSENSSSKEFDSWTCYESDAEIATLIDWLGDTDAREKDLKESLINWKRNKSNEEKGQVEMHYNYLNSSTYCTNARAELEKKFDEGQLVQEWKIRRCDCLEILGSTRHHCFSCHTTFYGHEVHQCDVSLEPKNESDPNGIIGSQPSSSSWNSSVALCGRASAITRCLKMILLDIEAALPMDAFRPSRRDPDRLRSWRAFLKSAKSILEMVQATIILEDMIKTEHLKKEWWYWSSPSAASKISTISSLSLRIYALDAAIYYEGPPPPPPPPPTPPAPVDLTEPVVVGDSKSKEETPKKSKLKNKLKACSSKMNCDDAESSKTLKLKDKKDKPKKRKLEVSIDKSC